MDKLFSDEGSISDTQVYGARLKNLAKLDFFMTKDEKKVMDKTAKTMKLLLRDGIRRLHAKGHSYTTIAEFLKVSSNDVLMLGDIDPLTIKPRE